MTPHGLSCRERAADLLRLLTDLSAVVGPDLTITEPLSAAWAGFMQAVDMVGVETPADEVSSVLMRADRLLSLALERAEEMAESLRRLAGHLRAGRVPENLLLETKLWRLPFKA
ncbi:MAG: hypothetical protein ACYCW6_28990 [Candidatus Xenobia bacterium]